MRMDPENIRKLFKRVAIAGAFFVVALLFYLLAQEGRPIWRTVLLVYALLVTVVMVLAILVQSGRGGGLAGLGGVGGESLLGARAATPIAKATYILGALLLFICMLLARIGYAPDVDAVHYTPSATETRHLGEELPVHDPAEDEDAEDAP